MEKCEHHWVIPNTHDERCQGICRKCGGRREFLNQMPNNENWERLSRKTMRVAPGGLYIAETHAE